MPLSLRRLFVALFVLLQALAPLLHAHAASAGHGGLHMPDLMTDGEARQQGPVWITERQATRAVAIGVTGSLEPRQDGPGTGVAAMPAPPWLRHPLKAALTALKPPVAETAPLPRLLPFTRAPPLA